MDLARLRSIDIEHQLVHLLQNYLGLSKSSAIAIDNFIRQLTFNEFLHGEILKSIIYNHTSIFHLVKGLFQINVHFNF